MRIAVTYHDGAVFEHFGEARALMLYDTQGDRVLATKLLPVKGGGHGAMAQVLQENHVDVLLCGGIGVHALEALKAQQVQVYSGIKGAADKAVEGFLNGTLKPTDTASCHCHQGGDCHCGPGCDCGQ